MKLVGFWGERKFLPVVSGWKSVSTRRGKSLFPKDGGRKPSGRVVY